MRKLTDKEKAALRAWIEWNKTVDIHTAPISRLNAKNLVLLIQEGNEKISSKEFVRYFDARFELLTRQLKSHIAHNYKKKVED